ETINVAQLYFEAGHVNHAVALLSPVLEADPGNHDALLLWEQIAGGASPESDTFDPNAPLPSYDLEEVSAEQAMHTETGVTGKRSLSAMDDPFGSPAGADEALPSLPLGTSLDGEEVPSEPPSQYDEEEEISSVE